jgi:hypothetical protein
MNHLEKINTYYFTLLCHFRNFYSPWRILILASFISLSTRSRSRSNQSARNFFVVGVLARLGEAGRGRRWDRNLEKKNNKHFVNITFN